jgi:hypothetical protein
LNKKAHKAFKRAMAKSKAGSIPGWRNRDAKNRQYAFVDFNKDGIDELYLQDWNISVYSYSKGKVRELIWRDVPFDRYNLSRGIVKHTNDEDAINIHTFSTTTPRRR